MTLVDASSSAEFSAAQARAALFTSRGNASSSPVSRRAVAAVPPAVVAPVWADASVRCFASAACVVLSHLAFLCPSRSVDDIRVNDAAPGLREHEACLLRLLEKVTNGTVVEINETGAQRAPGSAVRL